MTVLHKTLGKGLIQQVDENYMTVLFANGEQKKFLTNTCLANGLVNFENEDIQSSLQNYKNILRKDQQIRDAVRWAENGLAPYSMYLD